MISCCHRCLSTYALTRAYSQMLCCEHAATARAVVAKSYFLLNYGSLPVLLLSVFVVVAVVISVYAIDESTCA